MAIKVSAAAGLLSEQAEAPRVLRERIKYVNAYHAALDWAETYLESTALEAHGSFKAKDHSYLTAVLDNICISFVCRYPDCRFYGSNSDWVKHNERYKLRCPKRGKQYQRWVKQRGATTLLPFQKVVSILDPYTHRVSAVPATWPSSGEDDFLGKLALAQARKLMTKNDAMLKFRSQLVQMLPYTTF